MKIFFTSFLSVTLISINTIILTKNLIVGIFIVSFLISYIWTFNVQRIVFSTKRERFIYALGAGFGGVFGKLLYDFINYFINFA